MADHMPGEIWIGGTIVATIVNDLCEAIRDSGVALDWGRKQFKPKSAAELLQARTDSGDGLLLRLCNDEARYGQFENLEEFLRQSRIAFDRRADGKYEFDPELVEFRPELGYSSQITNHSGNPVIYTSELYDVAAQLATGISSLHQQEWQSAQVVLEAAYEKLHKLLPMPVPPLTTFLIADQPG